MAKHESTAINELIDLARSGKSVDDDDAVDLFRPRPTFNPTSTQQGQGPQQPRRAASGTSPAVPAIAVPMIQQKQPSMAPLPPAMPAFDVAQLSSPGMAIPKDLRTTTPGLPPPPSRRPGTNPPPPIPGLPQNAALRRPDGTPAPQLVDPAVALRQTMQAPPAYQPPQLAPETLPPDELAPETLPPDSLQLAPDRLSETELPQQLPQLPQLPPLPPATLAPATLTPAAPVLPPIPHRAAAQFAATVPAAPAVPTPPILPANPPDSLDVDVKLDIDRTGDADWFNNSDHGAQLKIDQTFGGTAQVGRADLRPAIWKHKAAIPVAVGLGLIAIFTVGALAFSGEGNKHDAKAKTVAAATPKADKADKAAAATPAKPADDAAAAAAAPAAAAPASSQAVAQKAAPAPSAETPAVAAAPTGTNFISVRFDSNPSGATVMLVDGGKTSFLGTTPVNASVDPTRKYDVVYTLANHPTQLQHFDPSSSHHMTASLGGIASPHTAPQQVARTETPAPAPAPAPRAQPAPAPAPQHVAAAAPTPRPAAAPVHHAAPVQAAPADDGGDDAAPATGPGTLMVASHPACEIFVDGRDLGMETPQKSISLAAGAHKVTLVNKDQNINKTVTVSISSGVATKVIKNF